jgi:hypothetical protein
MSLTDDPLEGLTPAANMGRKASKRALKLAKKHMKWAKKQGKKNNKIVKPYVRQMMDTMADLKGDYDDDRERYDTVFKPLQDEYLNNIEGYQGKADAFSAEVDKLKADAENYGSEANKSFMMGRSVQNVNKMFEDAREKNLSTLESYGINPSATRFGALDYNIRATQAMAQAQAGTQAGLDVDETSRAMFSDALTRELQARGLDKEVLDMKKGMVDLGEGVANRGIAEAGAAATIGGAGVNAKLAASELAGKHRTSTNDFLSSTGSLINSWTNALNTGYSNSLEQQKLEQTEQSGIGSIIGAVAGIGRSFFAEKGGRVPHALSPSGGAIADDVPSMLTSGEHVIDADTAKYFGTKYFDNLKSRAHDAMGIQEEVA